MVCIHHGELTREQCNSNGIKKPGLKCKECQREKSRLHYQKNKERYKENHERYQKEDPERFKSMKRKSNLENYHKNKKQRNIQKRKHYREHKQEELARSRKTKQAGRQKLVNGYVRRLLLEKGLTKDYITQEMIDIKRVMIQILRRKRAQGREND